MATKNKLGHYKMFFPQQTLGEPFVYKLSHDMGVKPNILRGRISENEAWLEIEIEGPENKVEKAIEYLRSKDVKIEEIK